MMQSTETRNQGKIWLLLRGWFHSGDELVKDYSQRIDIGRWTCRRKIPEDFGSDVAGGSHVHSGVHVIGADRQPEVSKNWLELTGDQNVGRFDITMEELMLVCFPKPAGYPLQGSTFLPLMERYSAFPSMNSITR